MDLLSHNCHVFIQYRFNLDYWSCNREITHLVASVRPFRYQHLICTVWQYGLFVHVIKRIINKTYFRNWSLFFWKSQSFYLYSLSTTHWPWSKMKSTKFTAIIFQVAYLYHCWQYHTEGSWSVQFHHPPQMLQLVPGDPGPENKKFIVKYQYHPKQIIRKG